MKEVDVRTQEFKTCLAHNWQILVIINNCWQ